MRILVSAFAFAPNVGSEPGVGWRWAMELARNHEVTVITDVTRRGAIEASRQLIPNNMQIFYFRPRWLGRVPLNSHTAQLLYTAWQFLLLGFARQLHRQQPFDLAMHVTYSVFRHPSFLGLLGIPFVFGPLGGGEDAPIALKRSIRGKEKAKEVVRTIVNKLALIDPFLWLAYSRVTLILTSTEQTRNALPWRFRNRALVYPNLGVDLPAMASTIRRRPDEPLRILFAGRMLGWKGVHLAIRAVAELQYSGVPFEFTLVGSGPYEPHLRRISEALGVNKHMHWIRALPQHELFALYRDMHCFLFPSLHDSGGTVILEAQAHGLPIICLDLGGPATLVTPDSAIIVSTQDMKEDDVVQELTRAIRFLAENEDRRYAMAQAALRHAASMTWENRVSGVFALLERVTHGD